MAGRFEELVAWQRARELKLLVYGVCRRPAIAADFKFKAQLMDAAASGPRNIAEGFGRFKHADFARFVRIARASELEVLNRLHDALDRGYLEPVELEPLERVARKALAAAAGLIAYLDSTPDV